MSTLDGRYLGSLSVDGVEFYITNASLEHRSYIISTWVRSYAKTSKEVRIIRDGYLMSVDKSIYLGNEPRTAEAMWHTSMVLVDGTNDAVAHAWICGELGKLYHCYVPPELRRMGICRSMVSIVCGPEVQHARVWPHGKQPKGWTYNPYLLGAPLGAGK